MFYMGGMIKGLIKHRYPKFRTKTNNEDTNNLMLMKWLSFWVSSSLVTLLIAIIFQCNINILCRKLLWFLWTTRITHFTIFIAWLYLMEQ